MRLDFSLFLAMTGIRHTYEIKSAMILRLSKRTNSSCSDRHLIRGPYGSSDLPSLDDRRP